MEYMSVCMYVYMTCKVKPITGLIRLISLSRLQSPSSRMIRCSYYSSVRHHRCHSVRSVGQMQSLPFTPACWDGDYMLLSMRVTQNYTGLTYTAWYHSSVSANLVRRRLFGGGSTFCGVSGSVSDSRHSRRHRSHTGWKPSACRMVLMWNSHTQQSGPPRQK